MVEVVESTIQETPLDKFRRSAGFQIMFVLHSGLEAGKAIDHLCASAQKLVAASREWQPIETAPRDKTEFLVYGSESGNIYQVYRYEGDDKFRIYASGGRVLYERPTHWMPMPDPPKE